MIKNIVRDTFFLSQQAELATQEDMQVCLDLVDTLQASHDRCVGMAANMIGKKKRIIIARINHMNVVMINPYIVQKSNPYQTKEGCLSLNGERQTTRYQNIVVKYQDMQWKERKQSFVGYEAQIIQHEIDHCDGILI